MTSGRTESGDLPAGTMQAMCDRLVAAGFTFEQAKALLQAMVDYASLLTGRK